MNFEAHDFEQDVINASHQIPVLVDFWAPWCGPCQILGPTLEKLAQQSAGKWKLAKWNVDEDPGPAQQFQVRGIPAVKLFIDGKVVAEFSGAMPEKQVEKWLEQHIPSEEVNEIDHAIDLLDGENPKKGLKLLERLAKQEPENAKVAFHLARALLFSDTSKANKYMNVAAADPIYTDDLKFLQRVIDLMELSKHPEKLEEKPVKHLFLEATKALRKRDIELALQKYIEVIIKDKSYFDEAAREVGVGIFFHLGPRHPITKKYRRRFDMALY